MAIIIYLPLSVAIAFALASLLLIAMRRLAAPNWVGLWFCVIYAFVVNPFLFIVLVAFLDELMGGHPGELGFVLGPLGGIGLLGGLIGASIAVMRHQRRENL